MRVIPRVAAVHDMSGYGKCSLTVAIPVLSACGVEVCPLPTALLSTNTQFAGFTFSDFTADMPPYLDHWRDIQLKLNAVYSGFLGSAQQISIILRMAETFAPCMLVVDPVMGDNGKVYATYTPEMCEGMRGLAARADVLTPNLTEACVLTRRDYAAADTSPAGVEAMARDMAAAGTRHVVITGIERGDTLYNCVLSEGQYYERAVPLLPYRMHGTGDLFTSVLTGGLLTGHSLADSVDSAARFVSEAMEQSQDVEDVNQRGVCFEPLLHCLRGGLAR